MERLTRLVDGEMEAATLEHNEIAELEELAHHLQKQLNKVLNRQSVLLERRDNDSPDVNTCCTECGGMMPTPERGGEYMCDSCKANDAELRIAFKIDEGETYPEDDHVLSTLPPTSDDDDEQDAEDDDSDHIYDPYAFSDGH